MYLGELSGLIIASARDQWQNRINVATMEPVLWNGVEIGFMFNNPLTGQRNYAQTYSGQVGTGSSGKLQYVRPSATTAVLKQTQYGGIHQQLSVYGADGKVTQAPVFKNNPVTDPTTAVNEQKKNNLAPWKDIAPLAIFVAAPIAAAAITAAVGAGAAAGGTAAAGGAAAGSGVATGGAATAAAAPVATAATVVTPAATGAGLLGTAKAIIGAGMTAFGAYQKFTENKAKAEQAEEQAKQMQEAQRFVEAQQQSELAARYNAEANEYARAAGMWIPGVDNRVVMIGGVALLAVALLAMRGRRRYKLRRIRSR